VTIIKYQLSPQCAILLPGKEPSGARRLIRSIPRMSLCRRQLTCTRNGTLNSNVGALRYEMHRLLVSQVLLHWVQWKMKISPGMGVALCWEDGGSFLRKRGRGRKSKTKFSLLRYFCDTPLGLKFTIPAQAKSRVVICGNNWVPCVRPCQVQGRNWGESGGRNWPERISQRHIYLRRQGLELLPVPRNTFSLQNSATI
jgi:hypothetical protein